MQVEFICKNFHLNQSLQALLEKKLSRFDKYFVDTAKAKVKLSTQKDDCIMEVGIDAGTLHVRSMGRGEKMNEIIDVILPKLERQVVKNKTKLSDKLKKTAFDTPVLFAESEETPVEPPVVKVKKFQVSVTTVENAKEEMELLGHDFYVFINGDTNKVCVLYRRNDGDFGLIEPEY